MIPEGFSRDHSWSGNMNCYAQAANVNLKHATIDQQIEQNPTTNCPLVLPDLPGQVLHYLRHLSLDLIVTDLAMLHSTRITNPPAALRILDLCKLLKSLRVTIRFVKPRQNNQPPAFDIADRATLIARLVAAVKGLRVPEKLIRMGPRSDSGGPWTVAERVMPAHPDTYSPDDNDSLDDSDDRERCSGDLDDEELSDEDFDREEDGGQTDETRTDQNEEDGREYLSSEDFHDEDLYSGDVSGGEVDDKDSDSEESEIESEEEEIDDDGLPITLQALTSRKRSSASENERMEEESASARKGRTP